MGVKCNRWTGNITETIEENQGSVQTKISSVTVREKLQLCQKLKFVNQVRIYSSHWKPKLQKEAINKLTSKMATSLGYVLMNWTSTFSKKKNRQKKKGNAVTKEAHTNAKETKCCQTTEMECFQCIEKSLKMQTLAAEAQKVEKSGEEVKAKLKAANASLATIMDVEAKLREDHEHLVLQEAQVRYDLEQFRKSFSDTLEERDCAHADRIRTLETVLQDKECEWAHKNEALRRDLRQAIRSSMADTEREVESLGNLEQEIESLKMVIEMRSTENRQLRVNNNQLLTQLERLAFLEGELANTRQRLDEMTMVLQNKMDSEKELLELSETLQQEYYERPTLKVQHSQSDLIQKISLDDKAHRNQHQQASSGKNNLVNVMNLREKTESVAWMIQMPTNQSPNTYRRNVK